MSQVRGDMKRRDAERVPIGSEGAGIGGARRALITAVALTVGLLSGCGATRPSKYYQLTVPADPIAVEKPDAVPVTLLLGALMTSHLYREDRIVYGNGSEQLGAYEYQRWAEPPTEMIQEVLLRELRASGRYRSVNFVRSGARGDYVLSGHLYDFKEVSGPPILARVTFELAMRDIKTASTVWNH